MRTRRRAAVHTALPTAPQRPALRLSITSRLHDSSVQPCRQQPRKQSALLSLPTLRAVPNSTTIVTGLKERESRTLHPSPHWPMPYILQVPRIPRCLHTRADTLPSRGDPNAATPPSSCASPPARIAELPYPFPTAPHSPAYLPTHPHIPLPLLALIPFFPSPVRTPSLLAALVEMSGCGNLLARLNQPCLRVARVQISVSKTDCPLVSSSLFHPLPR